MSNENHQRMKMRILIWVLALVCLFALWHVWPYLFATPPEKPSQKSEPKNVSERHVAGLILETSVNFQDMVVDFGPANEAIETADGHKAVIGGLDLQVTRILYKDGISLSLEGSVQGSINGFENAPGLLNLKHTEFPCNISGRPAVRVSITANHGVVGVKAERLTILAGQTLYDVQALCESKDSRASEASGKILDSIKIAP